MRAHGHGRSHGLEQREIRNMVAVERAFSKAYAKPFGHAPGSAELRVAVEDLPVDKARAELALKAHLRTDHVVDLQIAGDRLGEEERGRREDHKPVPPVPVDR